jgi:hypothetical protein
LTCGHTLVLCAHMSKELPEVYICVGPSCTAKTDRKEPIHQRGSTLGDRFRNRADVRGVECRKRCIGGPTISVIDEGGERFLLGNIFQNTDQIGNTIEELLGSKEK